MVDYRRLSSVVAEFARNLVRDYGVGDILYQLGEHATELLPVRGAGIMLEAPDGQLRFAAATDERITLVEELQVSLGEGPCLLAFHDGEQILVPDLTVSTRFPDFARTAVDQGMRAVFAFPMTVREKERIGGFNLYRDEPGPLEEADIAAGQTLADVATAYIVNSKALVESHRLADQLQHALDSRVVIEQAKGKLAAQLGVDAQAAFELLRRHARTRNRRLTAVAQDVMAGSLGAPDLG